MVRQTQLEHSLQKALVNRTITFQHLELLNIHTGWLTDPPQVRLSVYSQEIISSKQVQLLEGFLAQEMGQPFTLIFDAVQVKEITREKSTRSSVNNPIP